MKILRCLSMCLGFLAVLAVANNTAHAATRLTPQHLYRWADTNNTTRLHQFKRYINLQDKDKNTALCLAQQAKNKQAYSLLLKFGASTKVSCHDDDDPICAIIAGEKTKVSPAGLLLLGAGAAAGAYLLLDDDDDKKCKVADYPLDDCPDHGQCSACEDKKRLDKCDEFWMPNDERTECIPVPCPTGEYTSCEDKEGYNTTATPTSSKSGDAQCYRCSYQCDTTTGNYESKIACETANNEYICTQNANGCYSATSPAACPIDHPSETACTTSDEYITTQDVITYGGRNCYSCSYSCKVGEETCPAGKVCTEIKTPDGKTCHINATCPTGYTYTTQTQCETANPGYYCEESAAGSGCWKKNADNPKQCTLPAKPQGSCEVAKTGFVLDEQTTGEMNGDTPCVNCVYTCATGYYSTKELCQTTSGQTCTDISQQGVTCWLPSGNCPADYPYTSKNVCEQNSNGYACVESATGSGCWKPGTTPLTCPIDHPSETACTKSADYDTTEDILVYGGRNCYNCTYSCKANETSCPNGKVCTEVTTPDGKICHRNPQCPADYTYTSKAQCETANPGYYCEESAAGSGCWKKDTDNLKQCTPPAKPKGSCTAAQTGFLLNEQNTGEMNGDTPCVNCQYACDAANGYYKNYADCIANGFTCGSVEQNGLTCYFRNGSSTCPADHPSETACPRDDSKYVTTEDILSYGGRNCYSCAYSCKTGETSCPTGKVCTEVTTPDGTICYQNPQCPTGYTYTSKAQCETANPGYNCEESAAGSGCWKKNADDPKQCTPPATTEGSCAAAQTGRKLTETPNGEMSGSTPCVNCTYACDLINNYASKESCENSTGKVCTSDTLQGATCWTPTTQCPADYPYTSKTQCENASNGYVCVESSPGSGCWKPGSDKLDCPAGYDIQYQSVDNCGTSADNGWTYTSNGMSDGQKCGMCTKKPCPADTSTEYASSSKCDNYSNLTASVTGTSNYNGDAQCYQCNYKCNETTAFELSSSCTTGGWACTTETQNGVTCYVRNGSAQCPANYTKGLTDCSAKTHPDGWTYSSSGSSGGQPCGLCTAKKCTNIIDECIWEPDDAAYFDGNQVPTGTYAGDTECYNCYAICRTGTYTSEAACTNGGYTCTSSSKGSVTCWKREGPANCPAGYNVQYQSVDDCGASADNGWTYTSSGMTDGQKCGMCTKKPCPADTSTEYASSSKCDNYSNLTASVTGTSNYNGDAQCYQCNYKCNETTAFELSSSCTAGGWACTTETQNGVTCYVRSGTAQCPADHPSETACPTSDDYTTTQDVISYGGRNCYSCAYSCKTGETSCPNGKVCTEVTTPDGKTCYQNPQCPADYTYTTQAQCETANPGYNCTESATGSGCWKKDTTSPKQCTPPAVTKGSCETAKTGFVLNEQNTGEMNGDTPCVNCVYTCATGYYDSQTLCENTSGKTCTSVSQGSKTCWLPSGNCPADYPYTSKAACEAASNGYQCVESATGSGCWKPGTTPLTCQTGSTQYQSVDDCGSSANNGWNYTFNGYSGSLKCGICTPKACTGNTSTNYISSSNCPTVTNLKISGVTGTSNYNGDNRCYQCDYQCDEETTYTLASKCTEEWGSCKTTTISTLFGSVTCYIYSGSSAAIINNSAQNTTLLKRESIGEEDVYGLSNATETLKNTTSKITGESGRIEITHNSTGNAYGMFASKDNSLVNDTGASISIKNNASGAAYGMYASQGGTAINRGSIQIDGLDGTAYGIYGEGQNAIENAGSIDVSGKNAYGIYVKDGVGTDVLNTGTITVNASNQAHGIFIDQNSTSAVVNNKGTIIVNGETKEGQTGITLNGAKLKNFSMMRFAGNADLNALGGTVYLENGGVYAAQSLSGDLNVGTSTVLGSNLDTYTSTAALQTENIENLNLASESAMFSAETQRSEDGKSYDVVMNRKGFSEFTPNSSIASYLEANYQDGNLEDVYDSLKSETENTGVSKQAAKKLGYDILPNFADENFTALKSLNRNIADTILKPTDETNRIIAGYDNINWETDSKGLLSGADLSVNSMYTFGDKRLDNHNRLGLGLSYTKLSSDYDVGGDRDLNIVSIFMPYMHKFSDNLRLASVLSVGYGYGEYDRGSNNESDITDIFYGLTNELRYTINLNGFAELEPALMLNAIGYYEDGYDEGKGDEALETRKTHHTSVEAGVGLFLKKEVTTNEHGKFGFKVGGAYYRELASPYDDISGRMKNGNNMWYRINDYANLYSKDRAILEAMIDYEYKNLGVYAKYNRLIQKNNPQLFDLGIKYKF